MNSFKYVEIRQKEPQRFLGWIVVAQFFGLASTDSVFKFVHALEKEHPKSPIRLREISSEDGDDRVVYETKLKEV